MSPSPEVRIGERLRFYRQAKGKTQAVAESVNLSEAPVAGIY
jgi:transcriptional regulator with XRE-family HTH domain